MRKSLIESLVKKHLALTSELENRNLRPDEYGTPANIHHMMSVTATAIECTLRTMEEAYGEGQYFAEAPYPGRYYEESGKPSEYSRYIKTMDAALFTDDSTINSFQALLVAYANGLIDDSSKAANIIANRFGFRFQRLINSVDQTDVFNRTTKSRQLECLYNIETIDIALSIFDDPDENLETAILMVEVLNEFRDDRMQNSEEFRNEAKEAENGPDGIYRDIGTSPIRNRQLAMDNLKNRTPTIA